MKKFFLLAIFMYANIAQAQTAQDIKQIENYLNNMQSLQADFVQTASNGNTSEGKLYIAKPNKIRMEYADPTSVLIVGNGNYIVFNDKELDQVTNLDYTDVPATMILANTIKIDNNLLKIDDFYKDSGTTSITLTPPSFTNVGPITLVFTNSPFELKQWKIIDPQDTEVTLSMYNVVRNAKLNDDLFKFKKTQKNHRRRN